MHEDDLDLVSPPYTATAAQLRTVEKFWTPAKMKQAVPIEMPSITEEEHQAMVEAVREQLAGVDSSAAVFAMPQMTHRLAKMAASTVAQTKLVSDMSVYPYSTALKMFMTFPQGNMIGSAFIVGKRAVLTAAHCVCNGGTTQFASNIQFYAKFKNGSGVGPFNSVATTCLKEWTQGSGAFAYDIAACVVDKDFPEDLGRAGYTINQLIAPGALRSIGFPGQAQPPFQFNGNNMWTSLGDYADNSNDDPGMGTTIPRAYGHYNDMTGGCSGGPIFTETAVPMVVGLNSHVRLKFANGPRQVPHRMYSPFFGDHLKRLIKWLKDNGGEPLEPGQIEDTEEPIEEGEQNGDLKEGLSEVVKKLNELISKL